MSDREARLVKITQSIIWLQHQYVSPVRVGKTEEMATVTSALRRMWVGLMEKEEPGVLLEVGKIATS